MVNFRAGADIGGTFTDVVFLGDDGSVLVRKVASTPNDYAKAVIDGLSQGIKDLELRPQDISEISHGFTVATNAILEGKGERTALITTEGFRDVLELARIRIPRLYDLYYQKPPPLVERRLRLEVGERMTFTGEILKPISKEDVDAVVTAIEGLGVKSVAVSLLHSYANPAHEEMIVDAIKSRLPDVSLSVSSELLPEMREYERTSTTVINAYVRPVVAEYLSNLSTELKTTGVSVPLTVMQSNGGLTPVESAIDKPMYCIESGPAAGVVGAYHLGKGLGIENILTFDMGGTTAKASMIEDGQMLLAPEYEVGGGMSVGHRLLKGGGYILRVPSIDIAEVSAGGGSIAWVDKGGSLQSGPQSAGAVPGPVCYGRGGTEPTVTDANVVLGYLNPDYLLGGKFPIDSETAKKSLRDKIGVPLGMSDIEAANGVHLLVNSNMARALRAVSTERGRDPRKFTLIAFGGGGPIHAAGLAESLGITSIIIPPSPGVFSAFGLLFADLEHHFVQTHFKEFSQLDFDVANQILGKLKKQGEDLLYSEGFDLDQQQIITQLDMKYVGQTSELTVGMNQSMFSMETLEEIGFNYGIEHEKTYGYKADDPFQLVNIRVIARGISKDARVPDTISPIDVAGSHESTEREVYFGLTGEWIKTPVIGRPDIEGWMEGPVVIEEYDSTTIVPPKWRVSLDSSVNITIEKVN
ncbi:MAG: hydantoinase/oxoprolinase family protein [Chloroflexota bacterium]|nr:hydantoinase/oxoprolinase family protein [Chloroflexota bacterium]